MKISVIIAVYRRYKHFYWCIKSLANQTFQDFEVLVANDGATGFHLRKINETIDYYSKYFPIKHIWHEDIGFRKAIILNKAVKASRGEYLIFVDSDVIFHKHLIRNYFFYFEKLIKKYPKLLLTGDVIFLKKDISFQILNNNSLDVDYALKMIENSLTVKEKLYNYHRYFKYFYYKIFKLKYPKGWGANLAVTKEAYYSINGYNNIFSGRGEDTDFMKRLVLNGTKRVSINRINVAYHLFHKKRIMPDHIRKKEREQLKWDYYKKNPHLIITSNGINEV